MRTYNFPVSFAAKTGDAVCRVVLNDRFTPSELINDFPKTITSRYLNDVMGRGEAIATYVPGDGNAIDIVLRAGTALTDTDRAIVLNLLDFGQDYEAERSTTIKEAIFFVSNPTGMSADTLLKALASANAEAGAFMTDRLSEFPPDEEYLEDRWPRNWADDYKYDWSGFFFFHFELEFAEDLSRRDLEFARRFMDAMHNINMWDGYNEGKSARDAVASGRDGLSFEISVEGRSLSYAVERTPCDPAFSVKLLADVMRDRLGATPKRWDIRVEPED